MKNIMDIISHLDPTTLGLLKLILENNASFHQLHEYTQTPEYKDFFVISKELIKQVPLWNSLYKPNDLPAFCMELPHSYGLYERYPEGIQLWTRASEQWLMKYPDVFLFDSKTGTWHQIECKTFREFKTMQNVRDKIDFSMGYEIDIITHSPVDVRKFENGFREQMLEVVDYKITESKFDESQLSKYIEFSMQSVENLKRKIQDTLILRELDPIQSRIFEMLKRR
jgi:hypothetical protein